MPVAKDSNANEMCPALHEPALQAREPGQHISLHRAPTQISRAEGRKPAPIQLAQPKLLQTSPPLGITGGKGKDPPLSFTFPLKFHRNRQVVFKPFIHQVLEGTTTTKHQPDEVFIAILQFLRTHKSEDALTTSPHPVLSCGEKSLPPWEQRGVSRGRKTSPLGLFVPLMLVGVVNIGTTKPEAISYELSHTG